MKSRAKGAKHRSLSQAPAVRSGEVTGYTDDPVGRYVDGLAKIKTADALRGYLKTWPFLAEDAIRQAKGLTDKDVAEMQRDRRKEKVEVAERIHSKFGDILMPARMMVLSLAERQFSAPIGVIYIRMWETGEHDRLMRLS